VPTLWLVIHSPLKQASEQAGADIRRRIDNMRRLYLLIAVLGAVLPYYFFVPFLQEHGLDMGLFMSQLFQTRIGAFFTMDVIVSSLALWIFIFSEGRRLGMKTCGSM
jgi:hypothetical protein